MTEFGVRATPPQTLSISIVGACDPAVGPCEWTIGSLVQGTPYFVRVFSYNLHGFSILAGLPYPASEIPRTFPSPPQMVVVQPVATDATSLTVTFPPSANDGGMPVTKYLVEWDVMGSRAKTDVTLNDVLYSLYDVQAITTSAGTNDLGGTFRVSFEGYGTGDLSFGVCAVHSPFAPPFGRHGLIRSSHAIAGGCCKERRLLAESFCHVLSLFVVCVCTDFR